jgi:hypothetical protein
MLVVFATSDNARYEHETISDNRCKGYHNNQFMFKHFCNHAVYQIMWKYGTVRESTDDSVTQRMLISCWMTKATYTNSEYTTLVACPRQPW